LLGPTAPVVSGGIVVLSSIIPMKLVPSGGARGSAAGDPSGRFGVVDSGVNEAAIGRLPSFDPSIRNGPGDGR
jgi:hypothetical protein